MPLEPPLTATAQDRLKQVREQIDAALEVLVADMLALATAERDTALSEVQTETAAALEKARAEAERSVAERLAAAEAQAAEAERRIAEAQARAAEAAADTGVLERQSDLVCLERLLDGVRDLDSATTLSQVLDKLADHAATHVARVAVLLVRDGELRGWRMSGFGEAAADPSAIRVSLDAPTVVCRAVETVARATTGNGAGAERLEPPSFASLPDDRVGLALPVTVGVRTVAVLYADEDATEPTVPSAWPEALEMLARHAACRLELLTMARAYGLHAQPFDSAGTTVAQGGPFDSAGTTVAQGRPFDSAGATVAQGRPFDSAGTTVAQGRPFDSAGTTVAQGGPFDSAGTTVAQGGPFDSAGATVAQGGPQDGGQAPARTDSASGNQPPAAELGPPLTPPPGGRPPSLATDRPVETARADQARQASDEDASAMRYARLLISEIKLYHEEAVNDGRRDANLLARLGPEIARARRLYEERIPADVRGRADHFGQELVRTLANGDPSLLGQAT